MEQRPALNLQRSPLEKSLHGLGALCLLATVAYTGLHYGSLPDTIPTHFNVKNEVDGYGPRYVLIALPAIFLAVGALLWFISDQPHKFNYINKITPENAEREYRKGSFVLALMNALSGLLALVIVSNIVQIAQGGKPTLDLLFWPLVLGMTVVPMVILFRR
jgi:uncharacterized membrane protein